MSHGNVPIVQHVALQKVLGPDSLQLELIPKSTNDQVISEPLNQQIYAYKRAPSKVQPAQRISVAAVILECFTPSAILDVRH